MCEGYGAKRRAHDPDYEHVENAKYREYERLEAEGYDDEIKDPDTNRPVIKKVLTVPKSLAVTGAPAITCDRSITCALAIICALAVFCVLALCSG